MCHCEEQSDVAIPQGFRIPYEIATPVCALVRNDMIIEEKIHHQKGKMLC